MQVEQQRVRGRYRADQTARSIFFICTLLLFAVIAGVFIFVGTNAFRVFGEGANIKDFLLGTNWDPSGGGGTNAPSFQAGGLILGSIVITFFSVLIATPLAIGMALFFTEMCPPWLVNFLRPLIEIFTGMPSVVIGFFGLVVIVPFLQKLVGHLVGNMSTAGYGWGAATVVLLIMILPTIISISIDALKSVPDGIREASLALGSTRLQMMLKAVVPAATSGLVTAVILGLGRAIGETLAVSMVLSGHQLPKNLLTLAVFFQPNINITQAIVNDFGDTQGAAHDAYWTLAFILLVISFGFVCISRYLAGRSIYR